MRNEEMHAYERRLDEELSRLQQEVEQETLRRQMIEQMPTTLWTIWECQRGIWRSKRQQRKLMRLMAQFKVLGL